ncbi:hypothetical protein C4T75_20480 [Clostridioides difficile]
MKPVLAVPGTISKLSDGTRALPSNDWDTTDTRENWAHMAWKAGNVAELRSREVEVKVAPVNAPTEMRTKRWKTNKDRAGRRTSAF